MDYGGRNGKSTLRKILQHEKYQHLGILNARDVASNLDERARGYVFDVARSKYILKPSFYELLENIKDGAISSGKYEGSIKNHNTG